MARNEFELGELIENRYRILTVVGPREMGTLYRASNEAREGEIVALKTVCSNDTEAEASEIAECFRRKVQLLAQLRHPNLVSIYDYGVTTGGQLYFTTEWVEGQDLELDERWLEPEATIDVIVQICQALAYLHAHGIIHGDLKPQNVLTVGEQVKLMDFGLTNEIKLSKERARCYTLGYSAPEVRQPHPVDQRADLYSIGAMWYALLVGEPAMFMCGIEQLIRLTLEEALEAQRQIPKSIGRVITRLMATLPDRRYACANDVIAAVNGIAGSTYELETWRIKVLQEV